MLLESSVTPPTDTERLGKVLAGVRPAPQQRIEAAQVDATEPKRAPEEFGGFIDMVKAAHPTRGVIALLCWLDRYSTSDDSGAVDTSADGGVDSSGSGSDGNGSSGHVDGSVAGIAAGGSGGGTAKTKLPKKLLLKDAAQAAGVVLCVLDTLGWRGSTFGHGGDGSELLSVGRAPVG